MKRISKITLALSLGTMIIFGLNTQSVSAEECYGPEAMYGEGPVENCQKRAGKVALTKTQTSMFEEGMAIPGHYAKANRINSTVTKRALQTTGDMYSEGDVVIEAKIINLAGI